jgi:uncharacterized Zn-binding protein involved in type VI secretion
MPAISRVGDMGSHGGSNPGTIITGSENLVVNGIAAALVGSEYNCSLHGLNSIISSPNTTVINGTEIAVVGSITACGATITQGSPNTNAG